MKRLCVFIFALVAIGAAYGDDCNFDGSFCTTCPEGTYTVYGIAKCFSQCPDGSGSSDGTPYCFPCAWTAADEVSCTPCPGGMEFSDSWDNVAEHFCTPCAAGTYSDGSAGCTKCPAGTFSMDGASQCASDACPAGTYGDYKTRTCVDCWSGYPNSDPGATSIEECYANKTRDCTTMCYMTAGGCRDVTCNISSCDYSEYYSNGTIRSGCKTCNDIANDIKVLSVSGATPGFRVDGLSCKICPAGTFSPGGDVATCEPCPDGATSLPGAASRDECMRILNYLPSGETIPNKIYLAMKKSTQPSLAVQVGNNVFYGNMTPIPDDKTVSGMNIKYDDTNYSVSSNMGSSVFYIITTPDTTEFSFDMRVAGSFVIDWGDGNIYSFGYSDIKYDTHSHTYDTPGEYKIRLWGRATAYDPEGWNIGSIRKPNYYGATILFNDNKIAKIDGCLGCVFPTVDGQNPSYARTFYGQTNLRGEIPVGFFGNLSGEPHLYMFGQTFAGCTNLTGPTARNPDGSRLYDIEYNGEKWIDAYTDVFGNAFGNMYYGSGVDTDN